MANNLPANIRKHTLFQENEYSHTIVFPEGFTMPDSVTAEVRRDGVVQQGISPTVTVDNLRVTFTYTTEMLVKMYSRYEQYFIFGGDYLLGGYVLISNEFGDPDNGETNVIIAGDQVTTIEIPGLAIAEGKLQEVLAAAEQVSQDKQSVSSDKSDVMEAKDEVLESKRVKVLTFALVLPLCLADAPKLFDVAVDETLGNQTHIPYRWDGEILFMYDIYPSLTQPTL